MGIRVDKIESDVKNANLNIEDTRAEMRTLRTQWNGVTIATLLATITLFIWLDGKSDDKFKHLMDEIKLSNSQVNNQIGDLNSEVKNLSLQLVKINHSIAIINQEHEKLRANN